jgi:hypothetical protein
MGIVMALIGLSAHGQSDKLQNDIIQQRIEFLSAQLESSVTDYTELIEILVDYYENPLNINTASREDLLSLGLLSPFQADGLITYRIEYGDLLTVYELRDIEGMDLLTIQNILPFITTAPSIEAPKRSLKKDIRYAHHELFVLYGRTLEEQAGYMPPDSNSSPGSYYKGDPNRYFLRYRFTNRDRLSAGFTAEKDPGEEFFQGSNPNGFDFYSAHLMVADLGIVKKAIIGDFHAQFGQGLTFWSGFSFGKTADALNTIRYARGITPYVSRNENNFLRGGAVNIGNERFDFTGFYSNKRVDANLASLDTLGNDERVFTSIQTSGLHRTPNEIADKNAIGEEIMGLDAGIKLGRASLGARVVQSKYEGQFDRDPQPYQIFQLDTNRWYNAGLDAKVHFNRLTLFGEASLSNNGGWAYLAGAIIKLDDRFKVSVLNRNFQRDYLAVYAQPFSEQSNVNNERGTYFGIEIEPYRGVIFNGYIDAYAFDWLSYQTDAPSDGLDLMGRISWTPVRNVSGYIRVRHEVRERNLSADSPNPEIADQARTYWRFHLDYKPSNRLKMASRVEFSSHKLGSSPTDNGYVVFQDIHYVVPDISSTFTTRFALIDVRDFDARVFTYEHDVLYYFSVPAYNNVGWRAYLLWRVNLNKHITIWARISRSFLTNSENFGSGTERIGAPQRTDFRIQLRLKI